MSRTKAVYFVLLIRRLYVVNNFFDLSYSCGVFPKAMVFQVQFLFCQLCDVAIHDHFTAQHYLHCSPLQQFLYVIFYVVSEDAFLPLAHRVTGINPALLPGA